MYISTCEPRYVTSHPARQRLLLAAVVSGLLLAMLDQTIVGTALPAIVRDLDGWSLYLWVVTAYLVPATVALPVYARLSDRFGRRDLLLVGMVLFLAGSALSASAQDMTQLIAWRGAPGPRGRRARGPLVHPRRRPLRGPPQRRAAGHARRAHGHQLHRRPAGRWLPRRPRRLALGVPRQPPDRRRRAGDRGDRAAALDRAQRAPRRAARPRRHRPADRRGRPAARRPQPAHARARRGRSRRPAA